MKGNLRSVFGVLAVVFANAATTAAFSVGYGIPRHSATVGGRLWSQNTKLFMSDVRSVAREDSTLVDGRVGEEESIKYISQNGSVELNANAMFT